MYSNLTQQQVKAYLRKSSSRLNDTKARNADYQRLAKLFISEAGPVYMKDGELCKNTRLGVIALTGKTGKIRRVRPRPENYTLEANRGLEVHVTPGYRVRYYT